MSEKVHIDLSAAFWLVPAVALLIALVPLPYGYYTLLRIVVCGATSLLAYNELNTSGAVSMWGLLMGGVALLFNPIVPIHFSREIWAPIDILAAVAIFIHWRARG